MYSHELAACAQSKWSVCRLVSSHPFVVRRARALSPSLGECDRNEKELRNGSPPFVAPISESRARTFRYIPFALALPVARQGERQILKCSREGYRAALICGPRKRESASKRWGMHKRVGKAAPACSHYTDFKINLSTRIYRANER